MENLDGIAHPGRQIYNKLLTLFYKDIGEALAVDALPGGEQSKYD